MLTYERYIELGGDAETPRAFFNTKKIELSSMIDYYTFNRINYLDPLMSERVENTLMLLIANSYSEHTKRQEVKESNNFGVKSESVGSHRVDYLNLESDESYQARVDAQSYEIIKKLWAHTGLMFRGI